MNQASDCKARVASTYIVNERHLLLLVVEVVVRTNLLQGASDDFLQERNTLRKF